MSHSYTCSSQGHITMNCLFLKNKFMCYFVPSAKTLTYLGMRPHTHTRIHIHIHIRGYNSLTELSSIKISVLLLLDADV